MKRIPSLYLGIFCSLLILSSLACFQKKVGSIIVTPDPIYDTSLNGNVIIKGSILVNNDPTLGHILSLTHHESNVTYEYIIGINDIFESDPLPPGDYTVFSEITCYERRNIYDTTHGIEEMPASLTRT